MSDLDRALLDLSRRVGLSPGGALRLDSEEVPARGAVDALARLVVERYFQGRAARAPSGARASGDSGLVAHLTHAAHGSAHWETGWRLAKSDEGWAFVSNGRLCLFLDEPGLWSPSDARLGQAVAVRMPRVRENERPFRFTLFGGGGGTPTARYTKFFAPVALESAAQLVSFFTARATDTLAFSLSLVNEPRDFSRRDALCLDAGPAAAEQVQKLLSDFAGRHPGAFKEDGEGPLFTTRLAPGLWTVESLGSDDLGDGYAQRRARWIAEAVWAGLHAGEKTGSEWRGRLVAMGLA